MQRTPMEHRQLSDTEKPGWFRRSLGVFAYTRRAVELVWTTNRPLTIIFGILTVTAGLLPASMAYIGKLIIDGVIAAAENTADPTLARAALVWIGVEAVVVVLLAAAQGGLQVCESLIRLQLGHRVNVLILEKALTLSLPDFEDSEVYDQMTRARREASSRPLSLVRRAFGLIQNTISLVTYSILLLQFSALAVGVLALAAIPPFLAETRFAGEGFRLFRWRSPAYREQAYLETVIAREDYAKEVMLLGVGGRLLDRYRQIFQDLYGEDRSLTLRRGAWGFGLGLLSKVTLYGAYGWIAVETIGGRISLGEMTMYLLVFRQGQSAFSAILSGVGGMYEDNLYLSNLYEFLGRPGRAQPQQTVSSTGPVPGDGIRFEDVRFTYPGGITPALDGISLHLKPGEKLALVGHNGSGKTTLIKLLTRLYAPDEGRILLDGRELSQWDEAALRARIGVIFQDFVRYQFSVGENIGVGDIHHVEDADRWAEAAHKGMAASFIGELPDGYKTQLGKWFRSGQELSGGQWQKVALSRAFMREDAQLMVLDEPTSAMDAEAEAEIFDRVRNMTDQQMAILISHRFSTVRMADRIVVLERGRITESGDHHALMDYGGQYARLFTLQAAGYQ
ncbi:MAG: ATP-binding cassette subfamily B protein [Myxococcota bacterium]|jgi:ATP-binding cassette subfamily B protein